MSGFKVNARTIFHLGADLISSDAVALYELVKNAFDAGSEDVTISVVQRARVEDAKHVLNGLTSDLEAGLNDDRDCLAHWRDQALDALTENADDNLISALRDAKTLQALFDVFVAANEIIVEDTGEGMSLDDLREIFLTIGTTSRQKQLETRRKAPEPTGDRPILGEKGVGRLSTMRLGQRLRVETAELTDDRLNVLDIDWTLFARTPDSLIEKVPLTPKVNGPKPRPKGTTIRVRQLNADWSLAKLAKISREQFARLNDPFSAESLFPIDLSFNGQDVPIPAFRKMLLGEAHAVVKVSFGPEDEEALKPNGQFADGAKPVLKGVVDYRHRQRSLPIHLDGIHLRAAAGGVDDDILRALGPFNVEIYWFNRGLLEAVDTIGTVRQIQQLVNEWSGGIMVYRDGFRVGGYGSGADDWLDIDERALASGGYKVNRAQLVGRLSISSLSNPFLVDQTNREGLRDSPEKAALVALLKHLIDKLFRPFLDKVEREVQALEPVNLGNVAERVLQRRRDIAAIVRLLYQRYPAIKDDPELGGNIETALKEIGEIMRSLVTMGEGYEKGRTQMTLLAGLGLSVASLAHELRQATSNALDVVEDMRRRRAVQDLPTALMPLRAQLRTLLTRLKVLDPLVSSGRQVPVQTFAGEWVRLAIDTQRPSFERDLVYLDFDVIKAGAQADFELKVVPGMVVQIISNLLDNARYWVVRTRQENPRLDVRVRVELDVKRREVRVSDNGPGVPPSMRDSIFDAFVSTKPVGAGMGLGLFISREIATYSKAQLVLLPAEETAPNMKTTFALRFGNAK